MSRIRTACVSLSAALASTLALANPFPGADLANGRAINADKQCASCHTTKFKLNEAAFYQRDGRMVKQLSDLRRYVSLCNSELRLELFPEDERDVAAFLNTHFYKLRQ